MDIALSGMQASQIATDVTGQNVANSSVTGYSRQVPVQSTAPGYLTSSGFIGGGVAVTSIERMADSWTTGQLTSEMGLQGYYDDLSTRLSQVQTVFNESNSSGINSALDQVFTDLSAVASNPEDAGARTTFVNDMQLLVSQVSNAYSQLQQIKSGTQSEITNELTTVNNNITQLGELNGQISGLVETGQSAGDLEDQRDTLLQSLSSELGGQAYISADGSTCSFSLNGTGLVLGTNVQHLKYNGTSFTAGPTNVPVTVSWGQLGSMSGVVSTGGVISQYTTDLNNFSSALINQFNSLQQSGYGLDGSTNTPMFTGTNASNIAVNPTLVADPSALAASSTTDQGGNDVAQAMLNLQNTPVIGTATLNGYYQSIVSGVGAQTSSFTSQQSTTDNMVTSLQSQVSSVSGVDLNQEMTHLLQFQQVYNACSRLVTIADQMATTVLGIASTATG